MTGYSNTRISSDASVNAEHRGANVPRFWYPRTCERTTSARELLYEDIMANTTFKVTIGKFGDDDSADIKVDGRVVGWLERVKSERFASATSRARVAFVSHYTIVLTDDAADAQLRKRDVDSRADAKLEVTRAFEHAWEKLLSEPGKLCCGCSKQLTDAEIEACVPDHDEYCAACRGDAAVAAAATLSPTALTEAAQNTLALKDD